MSLFYHTPYLFHHVLAELLELLLEPFDVAFALRIIAGPVAVRAEHLMGVYHCCPPFVLGTMGGKHR